MLYLCSSNGNSGLFSLHSRIVGVVCCLLLSAGVSAGNYPDSVTREFLTSVQAELFNGHFERAYQSIDSFKSVHPSDPLGYLYKAGAYMAEMTDAEENLYPNRFHAMADSAIIMAQSLMDSTDSERTAWMYLVIGHARAYESLWESRFGSFTSALRLGLKAKSAYMDGLKVDSTVYDLYGGLGMYHYWKSAKAGLLRMIRLFSNEKSKGIGELYLTIDSSSISAETARNALLYIRLDQEQYDSVIAACHEMLRTYPDGRLFLWPMAQAYFESSQYGEAARVYEQIRATLVEDPGNYFNLIECDYDLYQCYEKLEDEAACSRAALELQEYYDRIPEQTRKRQRSKIGYLNRRAKDFPKQAGY